MIDRPNHHVVVCIHNSVDDVARCLSSLEKHWVEEGLSSLLLVDDNSEKPTQDYVRSFAASFEPARLLRLDSQHFYTRAANVGLRHSNANLTTLLNSDTIVTQGWARNVRRVFEDNPAVGIVGPLSNAASTQSVPHVKSSGGQTAINHLPDDLDPDAFAEKLSHLTYNEPAPFVPVVHGFCYTIHRKVIDTIGYLDGETFPTGYGEENDYSFRADDAGFALAVAPQSFVFHAKSRSYKPEQQQDFTRAGAQALSQKYSARRIANAITTMDNQPTLERIRQRVLKSWPRHDWLNEAGNAEPSQEIFEDVR